MSAGQLEVRITSVPVMRSFTGTHVIELFADGDTKLGVRAMVAMAGADGEVCGPFEPFVADQSSWYRSWAELLSEAVLGVKA